MSFDSDLNDIEEWYGTKYEISPIGENIVDKIINPSII